jgi:lactate dehydrogenase-like 2-hydroxyacid dehydrogenase
VTFFEDSKEFHDAGASLAGADVAVVAPSFACSRALLTPARRLHGIVSPITGIEGIDIVAATELGIVVANGGRRENTDSMAEATILLTLAALYDLRGTEAVLRDNLPRPPRMQARMSFSAIPLSPAGGGIAGQAYRQTVKAAWFVAGRLRTPKTLSRRIDATPSLRLYLPGNPKVLQTV